MFNCNILPVFLFFSFCSSPVNLCSFRSLSHLSFHIHSASLLTLSLPKSFLSPSVFPFTPGLPFSQWQIYSESDIAVKSLWRSMCAAWLAVLSPIMMESLAYLSYSSSCFAICLMYSRPLESNQYSTDEQIAVKP